MSNSMVTSLYQRLTHREREVSIRFRKGDESEQNAILSDLRATAVIDDPTWRPEKLRGSGQTGLIVCSAHSVAVSRGDMGHRGWRALVQEWSAGDFRDENGFTSLMHAVQLGLYNMAESIIQWGANVNARHPDGRSMLDLSKSERMTQLLVAHGANSSPDSP